MGGLVKSIGKTIKKIGKGISKTIKKLGPTLILAAAVWAGVAMLGAGGVSGAFAGKAGVFDFGASNFMKGLGVIKEFVLPQGMMGASESFTDYKQRVGGAAARGGGAVPSDSQLRSDYAKNISQGMTTGDAMAYMTRMNLLGTGVKAIAGLFEETEEEKSERKHETLVSQIDEIKSRGGLAPMKDPFAEFKSSAMDRGLAEPTFGRTSGQNFMTPAPQVTSKSPGTFMDRGSSEFRNKPQGLITQAANRRLG